jgi:hypothetical protein
MALPKPSSLRKRCVRDMLTKALNWAHVPAGISEDPGIEMSNPRMNFLECPDGSTILDIGKRIRPLLGVQDLGIEMSDP